MNRRCKDTKYLRYDNALWAEFLTCIFSGTPPRISAINCHPDFTNARNGIKYRQPEIIPFREGIKSFRQVFIAFREANKSRPQDFITIRVAINPSHYLPSPTPDLFLTRHTSASVAPSASLPYAQVATPLRSAFQLFDIDISPPRSATSSYCILSPQNLQILPSYPYQTVQILSFLKLSRHIAS